jgi:hypothetical protein
MSDMGGSNRTFLICRVDLPSDDRTPPTPGVNLPLEAIGTHHPYPCPDPPGWEGCIRTPICVQTSPNRELAYYDAASPWASGHAGTRYMVFDPPLGEDLMLDVMILPLDHPLDAAIKQEQPEYTLWALRTSVELKNRFERRQRDKCTVRSKECQTRSMLARMQRMGKLDEYITRLTRETAAALIKFRADTRGNKWTPEPHDCIPRTEAEAVYRAMRWNEEKKQAAAEIETASPSQLRLLARPIREYPLTKIKDNFSGARRTNAGDAVYQLERLAYVMDVMLTERLTPKRPTKKDWGLPPENNYSLWTHQAAVAPILVQKVIDWRMKQHPGYPIMSVREVAEVRQAAMRESLERYWMTGGLEGGTGPSMPPEQRAKKIADWFIPLATTGEPHAFVLMHKAVMNPVTKRLLIEEAPERAAKREATRRASQAEPLGDAEAVYGPFDDESHLESGYAH